MLSWSRKREKEKNRKLIYGMESSRFDLQVNHGDYNSCSLDDEPDFKKPWEEVDEVDAQPLLYTWHDGRRKPFTAKQR